MIINRDSFIEGDEQTSEFFIGGTVEVTLRGETRRVRAHLSTNGDLCAAGMTGRYQTGAKAWPATVTLRTPENGKPFEFITFGRDDRSGKFKKENCISFAEGK